MGKVIIKQFRFGEWNITVDNISGDGRIVITREMDNSEIIIRKHDPLAYMSNRATVNTKQINFYSLKELEEERRAIYYER